jgi:perosamine synthetase
MVELFEKSFARYLQVEHAIAVTSGTTALHLALAASGVGPGDEVLVPDLTYIATANAVAYTGATPVLVDVARDSWCISLEDAERHVSTRTRAILPVHLYGAPCDWDALVLFARRHDLVIIEDAAEALGGSWDGRALGTLGDAGAFSFYGNKIMTTGEGGAVVTNDDSLARRLRHLRGMAQTEIRYAHDMVGFNYRMTDLQAAVGVGQLQNLDAMIARRREIVEQYHCNVGYNGSVQPVRVNTSHAPWLFTFQIHARDLVMSRLQQRGIETRPTFVPLHRMPMFEGTDEEYANASALGDHGISLPTFADMTDAQVEHVCRTFNEVYSECSAGR